MPEGKNTTAICVKKDTTSIAIRSSETSKKGNIFTLVMEIKNITFGQANKYLHNLFGLKYEFVSNKFQEPQQDPLAIFKKVKKRRCVVNQDIPAYDENCLKEYVQMPHINWIREGILPFACERFNIGYSYDRHRIVIPERKWDGEDNEYVGISGRTTVPMYEELNIPKYFKLSKTYLKGSNVYGINENYKTIQEQGICCVLESQKSVLKRYSRKDGTCAAIGNCELTDEQVKILISLDVEICIMLDEGIPIEHIWKECDKFYPIRKISYVFDRWGLLTKGSKDSPADLPNKQYEFMKKHRTDYNENERRKYKIWQEKQKKN